MVQIRENPAGVSEKEEAMPLNWSIKRVKNADDVCYYTCLKGSHYDGTVRGEEYVHPITNSLIWLTMSIGLNTITLANIDDWEKRLALAYHISWVSKMTLYNGNDEEGKNKWEARLITRADLMRHIGLETNANFETAREWRKRVFESVEEEGLRELRYAEKENPTLDKIAWSEHLALRDRIRSGAITKEQAKDEEFVERMAV